MRTFGITINDVPFTEQCRALTFTEYVAAVGRFDADIVGTHGIDGFQTVKIYDDGVQVFQGRVGTPIKENVPGGSGMPLGGLEWTGNLKDYLTNYADKTQQTLTEFLTDALVNSIYGIGDIDELSETEIEMQVWNTALEFLPFTFSDSCIVYSTDVEITDEPAAGTYEFPDSNRRTCFYDYANNYFYIIGYDSANSLLKYNSTTDFATWKGWTSLGFNKGNNGNYGIVWDESNALMYLVVEDGTNVDFYEYSTDGTGTLTQQDFDDNVATNSDVLCGPMIDSEGDVWFIAHDTTASEYELWQFDISANTWTEEADWAVGDNDDPKYMFMGSGVGDVIVIMFDDDANDLEEWLWDESGSTFAFVRKIADVTTCGYACGFQDTSKNMFIVWEDTDLDFTRKDIGSTVWETPVEVVDTADYSTLNQFQLSGDEAQNLYLFYLNDDGATRTIDILRRFEEAWESTATVNTDADTTSQPHSPENGLALFVAWLDTGDDPNASLMSPYAITNSATYSAAEETHDYESGYDFDAELVNAGATFAPSLDWAADGVQSMKSVTAAKSVGQKNAFGYYYSPDHSEIWVKAKIKVTQADDWGTLDVANDNFYCIIGNGASPVFYAGWGINGAGVIEWRLLCRDGAALVSNQAGTPVVGTEYCMEVHWYEHATAGFCNLYIDGALMCTLTTRDTADYGDCESLVFGLSCNNRDGPTTLYFDSVAWGLDGDNRVGCDPSGWFRTDSYAASGSMNEWGSLDSTDDDDANVSWGVWSAVPVLIVDGLITAVDLEDAGVLNTDTPIQIRADISGSRTYVQDVRLSEKQGFVDYLVDNEPSSTAVKKVADILGYEYKLGWDNLVDMKDQIGEDKTDYIILKTAKSISSYPEIEPNIIIINREPDFDSFANAVKVLGAGDYPTRKEGQAQDQDSQEEFGVHWISLTNKDCTSVGMSNTYARTEVNMRKDPLERIDVSFYDDYDSKDIEIGDIITVVDEETELDQSARIVSLTYGWNASGRFANASLINRLKAKTFIEYLAEVTDLKRWV